MKVLSVCQPWAWLLVNGYKDVENRSWRTSHRGPLLIHSGAAVSGLWRKNPHAQPGILTTVFKRLRAAGIRPPKIPPALETGGIVGRVELLDCVTTSDLHFLAHAGVDSPWFFGPVGWLVGGGTPLPFVPLKGKLHVFEFPGGET